MKSRQYLVRVCRTELITYLLSATSRKEAAQEVKKLSPHQRAMSFETVGQTMTDRVTSVITKDLIPKKGVYIPPRKKRHGKESTQNAPRGKNKEL
jgi:hypothetical protein